ncbi:MAG: hypothetical protein JW881_18100 [Spirochaetales bacterium]|nr:hypothetical protein [Spirochaetales bacterium]
MMKTLRLSFLVMALVIAAAFYGTAEGRDVVDRGEYHELDGTLYSDGAEYYLDTGSVVYSIHLGPDWYSTEIGFPADVRDHAVVKGFVCDMDAAPVAITLADEVYAFRGDDGRPLWAGRGNGRNRPAGGGTGRGTGGNR